ncbi:MAG: glycosyltransferase [Caulobacteraceae bacterium]
MPEPSSVQPRLERDSSPSEFGAAGAAASAANHCFVVVAFGDSPFLAGCLASLRSQTLAASIVVATSTPSPFIARISARFAAPVIVNSSRRCIADDWNFALAATGARYVTLAHQDDVYFPDFLERSLETLAASPKSVFCFTGYEEITDHGAPRNTKISFVKHLLDGAILGRRTRVGGGRLRAFLSLGNPLACSSVTFDRERTGGFAFSREYRSNLDWDAWLRLLDNGGVFARLPERLVGRRHNGRTETSRLIREGVRQREDLALFRRLWPRPVSELIAQTYRASY